MKRFYTNVSAANPAFKETPELFQPVSVDIAANVFFGMVNRLVNIVLVQSVIGRKRISERLRTRFNVLANFILNRCSSGIGNAFQFDLAATFQDSHDNLFTYSTCAASAFAPSLIVHGANLSPDIGFVRQRAYQTSRSALPSGYDEV